ncbi:MAG: right-handed parallel beta-helix repeat-containing protein [Candidatus Thorarchaeota archaeon]
MRSGKFLLACIVLLVLLSGSYSSVTNTSSGDRLPTNHGENRAVLAYTPHGPISIASDADFETQSWPGNGTMGDPYIISGLNISITDDVAIDIRDTRAHFKVMNCLISSTTNSNFEGVYLENVTNGVVRDCIVESHIQGFFFRDTVDCTLINNTASSNIQNGFIVFTSDNCTLTENNATNNGDIGFLLTDTDNSTLVNNTAEDNNLGIRLGTSVNCTLTTNTVIDNAQWGIRLESHADNCTLTGNTAINSNRGFALDNTDNCTLIGNTAEDNSYAGFYLGHADNCSLLDNIAENNARGFRLYYSYGNMLYGNTMISNSANAEDEGGVDNLWDDGVSIGNIWDDYDGSGTYPIPGGAGSVDHYPLLYDLVIPTVDSPNDVSYTEGTTGNSINWTASDANPSSYVVYRDESVLVSDSWDGSQVIVIIDGLAVGTYDYTLEVMDLGGNTVSDSVTVTVTAEPTTSTTPTGGPTTPDGSLMTIVVIGAAGAVVIIIIIIVMKKKS